MRPDRNRSRWLAVHGTAVVLDGAALLLVGPSRSGKSDLAWTLLTDGAFDRPVSLLGDDRVMLRRPGVAVLARPHLRIAGFIERRGVGFVAVPWCEEAPVVAIARTGGETGPRGDAVRSSPWTWLRALPELDLSPIEGSRERRRRLLPWWASLVDRPPAIGRTRIAGSPQAGVDEQGCGHN